MSGRASRIALVIVAHGERGGGRDNRTVLAHAEELRRRRLVNHVSVGFLKSEPTLEQAIKAAAAQADHLVVYPFLMSDGYFSSKVVPRRLSEIDPHIPVSVLPPLGLDERIDDLLLARSLLTAQTAGFSSGDSRLLVVGHGSKLDVASVEATRAAASRLAQAGRFRAVGVAFLEEPPFLQSELVAEPGPVIVAGFFSGEGLHAWVDVPAAIEEAGVPAAYTGPVGASEDVPDLIEAAIRRWFANANTGNGQSSISSDRPA